MRTIDVIYINILIIIIFTGRWLYSDYKNKGKTLFQNVYFYFEVLFLCFSFLMFLYPRLIGLCLSWAAIVFGINTWRDDRKLNEKKFSLHWINSSGRIYIGCICLLVFGIILLIDYLKGDSMAYLFK